MEVELQLVSLEDEEEAKEVLAEEEAAGADDDIGPKSVLEDIDWNELGKQLGGQAMGLGRYKFACFLTNEVRWAGSWAGGLLVSFVSFLGFVYASKLNVRPALPIYHPMNQRPGDGHAGGHLVRPQGQGDDHLVPRDADGVEGPADGHAHHAGGPRGAGRCVRARDVRGVKSAVGV